MTSLSSQRGATFIEVVAAVTVFAVVAVGLSPALLNARKMAALSQNQSTATALAQDRIDRIRAKSPTSITAGNDTQGIFTRTWSLASSGTSGLSRLTVTVTWRDRNSSNTNSVSLITLVQTS